MEILLNLIFRYVTVENPNFKMYTYGNKEQKINKNFNYDFFPPDTWLYYLLDILKQNQLGEW